MKNTIFQSGFCASFKRNITRTFSRSLACILLSGLFYFIAAPKAQAFEWDNGGWVYNISYAGYTATLIRVPSGLSTLNLFSTVPYGSQHGGPGVATVTAINLDNMSTEDHANWTSIVIPEGITHIIGLGNCPNLTSISIPQSVIHIGPDGNGGSGLSNCPLLTSIILSSHLEQLSGNVFENNIGLTSITLESDAEIVNLSIAGNMFKGCVNLTTINYNIKKQTYGNGTAIFSSTSNLPALTTFNIGANVDSMPILGFSYLSNLTTITIADGAKKISLDGAKITSIYIPPSVTSIDFSYCDKLESVTLPNSVEYVSLRGCDRIKSVLLPNSVTSFDLRPMDSLTSVKLPDNLPAIPVSSFEGDKNLSYIELPASIESIGNRAFLDCSGFKQIKVNWQTPMINMETMVADGSCPFHNFPFSKATLIVPRGTAAAYRAAEVWKEFINIVEDDEPSATTTNNSAEIKWYPVSSATNYTLSVYSDAARTQSVDSYTVAAAQQDSFMYTVNGLSAGTTYYYTLTVFNGMETLATYDKQFTTTGSNVNYQVTVSVNDATMGNVSGSGNYRENTTVTVTAMPNTGFKFVQWQEDGNTNNPRSFTLTQDTSFTAVFDTVVYHVTLTSNDNNRGTLTGNGDYTANSSVSIEAIPNTGYRFVFWSDGNTDNPRNITVTGDITLTAIFGLPNMYYVYVTSNNPNMGNVSGSNDYEKSLAGNATFQAEYAAKSVTSIQALPNNGYRFVQWNDNNTENPRRITVMGDSIFTAMFDRTTGIEEMKMSQIKIYPNPATDNFYITLPENVLQAVFTLYDMQGKAFIKQEIGNEDKVSVNDLAAGIYIYKVATGKESYQGKIIIKK